MIQLVVTMLKLNKLIEETKIKLLRQRNDKFIF